MTAAFTLQEMPEGKWRLMKGTTPMGIFASPEEGEEGIKRIVHANIRYYDANGVRIT